MTDACENCAHAVRSTFLQMSAADSRLMECHAEPPQARRGNCPPWPIVRPSDFCGHFKAKKGGAK